MPRKKRPLDRDSGVLRDASLLVVACEDTHAVKQYFARFRTRRVQFVVLPTERGCSSPQHVLARLDEFKRSEATEQNDLFWVCIDRDHWAESNHIQNLVEALQQCRQKGYGVAISNPCFELWLLLHFEDFKSPSATPCSVVTQALRKAAGEYQKNRCDRLTITAPQVRAAVTRARKLDGNPDEVLPSHPMTRMYRLIEVLEQRDSIDLSE